MVDAVYDVGRENEVVQVGVRSWAGSRGSRALDASWGFDSLVAAHAADFLHSAASVSRQEARALTQHVVGLSGQAELSSIVVGDVSCELWFERGAIVTIAMVPSHQGFSKLGLELLITMPPRRGSRGSALLT